MCAYTKKVRCHLYKCANAFHSCGCNYDYNAQKIKFFMKEFFSKCDQIRQFFKEDIQNAGQNLFMSE